MQSKGFFYDKIYVLNIRKGFYLKKGFILIGCSIQIHILNKKTLADVRNTCQVCLLTPQKMKSFKVIGSANAAYNTNKLYNT